MGHTIQLVAAHDYYLEEAQKRCKQFGCDEKFAFGGGDGYFKMLDVPGIEIVILGAPPAFRPRHLDACIKAGKHVFAEKPMAVDPQGVRLVLECAAAAKEKKLTLVTGTQRRHQGSYMAQELAVQKGQLGNHPWRQHLLVRRLGQRASAQVRCHQRAVHDQQLDELGADVRRPHRRTARPQHRRRELVHRTLPPHRHGRRRAHPPRQTGNQYDFFSVDFDYGDGLHIHSLARQIPDCAGRIGELFSTDVAEISGGGKVSRYDGKDVVLENLGNDGNPYVNEHSALLEQRHQW